MKKKYKVLVATYFNKENKETYAKGSVIELDKEKGEYLEYVGCVKKINDKKLDKEQKNE